MPDPEAVVRAYYRSIDEGSYRDLGDLLVPEFVHERPDRTLDGRDRFVRFMREERPVTDTSHEIERVLPDGDEVVVQGRLLRGGEELFGFVDVMTVSEERIERIRTYTK